METELDFKVKEWGAKWDFAHTILWLLDYPGKYRVYDKSFASAVAKLTNEKSLDYLRELSACVCRITQFNEEQ